MAGEPLGRHLVRGAVGFGALAGAIALVPLIGVAGLVLAQVTNSFGGFQVPSQNGFRLILAIGCGASLLALAIAAFLPRHTPPVGRPAVVPEALEADPVG